MFTEIIGVYLDETPFFNVKADVHIISPVL
jgi:hypothetical protein